MLKSFLKSDLVMLSFCNRETGGQALRESAAEAAKPCHDPGADRIDGQVHKRQIILYSFDPPIPLKQFHRKDWKIPELS